MSSLGSLSIVQLRSPAKAGPTHPSEHPACLTGTLKRSHQKRLGVFERGRNRCASVGSRLGRLLPISDRSWRAAARAAAPASSSPSRTGDLDDVAVRKDARETAALHLGAAASPAVFRILHGPGERIPKGLDRFPEVGACQLDCVRVP